MSLQHYQQAFDRYAAGLPETERTQRSAQFASFAARGFPHKKMEEWRYTDISALAQRQYGLVSGIAQKFSGHQLPHCTRETFVNGEGVAAHTREAGGSAVAQLNAAFAHCGYSLDLDASQTLQTPQHVLTWCESEQAVMAHLRHRIKLGPNARATVIMQHAGQGDYLTTQFTDIELAPGSHLTLYRFQDESVQSHHIAQTEARLSRDSRLEVVSIDLGAGLARHDLNVSLVESGAEVHVRGLYAPAHGAHVDNHTRIEHRAPHCLSREFFRGVVNEDTRAIFNGKIYVAEGARKTDSEQRIANLLLSPKAEVNAKPELEIYNDDVKCAHGATFGQLDEDAIYYLRARGIDRETARALLTYSFAREILDHIAHDELRERVTARLLEHLPQSQLLGSFL